MNTTASKHERSNLLMFPDSNYLNKRGTLLLDGPHAKYPYTVPREAKMLFIRVAAGGGNGGNTNVTSDNKQTTDNSYVFKILEQQLAVKDKQIENKDSQISQMQNLLDQQQRLALQDKQLLEEYKAEIKDLKALTMAPHDDGEKEVTSDKQPESENSTPESQPKPKKWWRFGK